MCSREARSKNGSDFLRDCKRAGCLFKGEMEVSVGDTEWRAKRVHLCLSKHPKIVLHGRYLLNWPLLSPHHSVLITYSLT
jgi:hypothetical protein